MGQRDLRLGERPEKCRQMRHDCQNGERCFEKIYRCHLGKLDFMFPGNNGLTDIDGYCCVDGKMFFLEWKTNGVSCPQKQKEALMELSKIGLVVIASGDPVEMKPSCFIAYHKNEIIQEVYSCDGEVVEKFDLLIREYFGTF